MRFTGWSWQSLHPLQQAEIAQNLWAKFQAWVSRRKLARYNCRTADVKEIGLGLYDSFIKLLQQNESFTRA